MRCDRAAAQEGMRTTVSRPVRPRNHCSRLRDLGYVRYSAVVGSIRAEGRSFLPFNIVPIGE